MFCKHVSKGIEQIMKNNDSAGLRSVGSVGTGAGSVPRFPWFWEKKGPCGSADTEKQYFSEKKGPCGSADTEKQSFLIKKGHIFPYFPESVRSVRSVPYPVRFGRYCN